MAFTINDAIRYRQRIAEIREQGRLLFVSGSPGIQAATNLCQSFETLTLDLWQEILQDTAPDRVESIRNSCAVIAVGGTGRGEVCPFSDVDILFLDGCPGREFGEIQSRMSRACNDSWLELGASIRSIPQCIEFAKNDAKFATSLVESRLLWGAKPQFDKLVRSFRKQVIQRRPRQFLEDCVRTRESEWKDGRAVQELEPDIKTSSGGLRDLHLIRWVGYATHGVSDIDSLRMNGALEKDEALVLKQAWEFLTWLRINLHYHHNQAEEKFSRDEQLRVAQERSYQDTETQRGVERLMQEYFRHTTQVASITRRFVARNRPRPLLGRVRNYLVSHRAEGVLHVGETVDCTPRGLSAVTRSLASVLRVYRLCASQGLLPSQALEDGLKRAASKFKGSTISSTEAGYFLEILKYGRALPQILRSMVETEILDLVLPEFTRIRCLMQFNPYHHFTVDEHTIRAVTVATHYPPDSGPLVQQVYREMENKALLHLALLLHDIGKGFIEDHCLVGERIAVTVGQRLCLPPSQIDTLKFLIRWHLEMADIAFRRDHTDEEEIVRFSQRCETPERLQMLFALTVADVTAVGPGTWSHWKALQLGEFYDRSFVVLSGRHYGEYEAARLRQTTTEVGAILTQSDPAIPRDWIESQLAGLSSYYFTCTEADRVAADLRILHRLTADEVIVDSHYEPDTQTVEYRIFTCNAQAAEGCFHRLAGVLTALHMSILSAEITTTNSGAVIDSFHVRDRDYEGEPRSDRRETVARTMREMLLQHPPMEELFRKNRRYGADRALPAGSEMPTRVRIDTTSSDSRTILEVFAHNRTGLLYSVSQAIYDLRLSVELAKIATHLDQVLDVFYVRELDGSRVTGEARLAQIQSTLETRLVAFESNDWREFA
jgi:[protein-PII] uridylyltransferase